MKTLVDYIYYESNKYSFDCLDEQLLNHLNIEHAYRNQYNPSHYCTFESLGIFKGCKSIVNYIVDNIENIYANKTINASDISNELFFDKLNLTFDKNSDVEINGEYKIGYEDDSKNDDYDSKRWNNDKQKFNFIDITVYNFDDPKSEHQVDDLAEILTHELTHAWDDYILRTKGNSSLRNKHLSNDLSNELEVLRQKILMDSIFKYDKSERDKYKEYLNNDIPDLETLIYYLDKNEQTAYISQLNQVLKNKKFEKTEDLVKYLNDKSVTYYNYKTIFMLFHDEEYTNRLIEIGLRKSSVNKLKKQSNKAWNKIVNHLYHILEEHKAKPLNEGSSKVFLRDLRIKLYKR